MTRNALWTTIIVLGICTTSAYAQSNVSSLPIYPDIWYRPDSLITRPVLCDTISLPASYTMIMVYRSLRPDTMQQLWKINRMDGKYYSVRTHAISTEKWEMPLSSTGHHAKACIYSMQHTLSPDTSYHGSARLFIGADTSCISDIELYEAAYFDSRLSIYRSLMFQTYLAIKYGVTLDSVCYISTSGDTLWNAIEDKAYYHRIHGIGTDSVYHLCSIQSTSLEDSLIQISVNDTLPISHYVIIGDNNAEAEWQPYENSLAMLRRIWKVNIVGKSACNVQIKVDTHVLHETTDTTWLAVLNGDLQIKDLIPPDSVDRSHHYYSISARKDMLISFARHFAHKSMPKKSILSDAEVKDGLDYIDVIPNPTHGDYNVNLHLAEEKPVTITIWNMAGQIVSSQQLNSVADYKYKDRITSSGVYTINVTDNNHKIIATTDLIVY